MYLFAIVVLFCPTNLNWVRHTSYWTWIEIRFWRMLHLRVDELININTLLSCQHLIFHMSVQTSTTHCLLRRFFSDVYLMTFHSIFVQRNYLIQYSFCRLCLYLEYMRLSSSYCTRLKEYETTKLELHTKV